MRGGAQPSRRASRQRCPRRAPAPRARMRVRPGTHPRGGGELAACAGGRSGGRRAGGQCVRGAKLCASAVCRRDDEAWACCFLAPDSFAPVPALTAFFAHAGSVLSRPRPAILARHGGGWTKRVCRTADQEAQLALPAEAQICNPKTPSAWTALRARDEPRGGCAPRTRPRPEGAERREEAAAEQPRLGTRLGVSNSEKRN